MKKKLVAIIFAVSFTFAFAGCVDNSGGSSQNSSTPDSSVCSHIYDNACDADCNVCGEERTPSEHVYTADCDANCNVCGDERTPTAEHTHDNACDADCNVCSATRTPAAHQSENADGKCDVCGESFKLSGGEIAGIAVGSTALVGAGGFSLFWFLFKKKKQSDLDQ